ncbi:MAG TPA: response regulator [Pyrinomonadaceae bacterium]|nr:response regulator [Pyrinomonadaceae bacterium]
MEPDEKINILMVDDSATNLLALEAILQAEDRNLVSASSGEDALRYLLTNEVAVILMDVYMPGLDGLETAELIRGRDKSRNIPIIFLTADSTGGRHLSRGYSLGAVDYIVKPIEPDILRSKVAVFVELFKKTQEVKQQAELLREKNLELENANLARLNMLIALGQELASERDPWRVLENFCKSARQIIDAEESAVGVLGDEPDNLRYFFRCTTLEQNGSGNQIAGVVKKALKQVVTKRGAIRLNESDQLLQDDESTSATIRSFLGAPIFSASRVCGWVYMLNKSNASEFSEADERLAATLTTQVAIAYENARLYTDAQSHAAKLQLEITERKQAEVQRAEMLVREQAARAEAEQANRTKDEFLATLSHELRTPLTAILGWSHLVRTGKLEPVQLARALETIERNARSQSQLIDDLLDVSRIITGKLQIEPRAVDLGSIIESAVEAVRPSFEAKSIKFEITIEPDAVVMGDANRLQQVFWNLLSNAVKFTPESGTVRIEARRVAPMVRVSVTDTGIGIKPEFLPFIFDRFRQADGSTTRVHGGLGLGLSIVRHLVQMHNGRVQVHSDGQNQGAVFSVEFPLASASSTPVSPNGSSREAELDPVPAGFSRILEGLRIVVVDDEADARELVRAILTRCGGEVNCCESAAEAMKAIREWKPDLLVSDIGMPNEDGYSLIKKVRKLRSKRSKLPAVALTAYATKEDKARALETGFQMHVAKPIEPETLVMSIASTVGRKM